MEKNKERDKGKGWTGRRRDTINRGKHFRRQGGDEATAYCRSKARGNKEIIREIRMKEERGKMGFRGKDIDVQAKEG